LYLIYYYSGRYCKQFQSVAEVREVKNSNKYDQLTIIHVVFESFDSQNLKKVQKMAKYLHRYQLPNCSYWL